MPKTLDLSPKKMVTPKSLTFQKNFTSEFGGVRGYNVTQESLQNSRVQRKNRTYDAIVDSEGNADFNTIEAAVEYTESVGGGDIFIWGGTYTPRRTITINSPINFVGQSTALVIVDFNSTAFNFTVNSGLVYITGTITSITSGVNVTGSGTAWLANIAAGQYIFLGTRWYLIAAVTGDTTLTLAEAYSDNLTMPGLAYRVSSDVNNLTRYVSFEGMTIKNSTSTGIAITDVRNIELKQLLLINNNKGSTATNVSEYTLDSVGVITSTSNGVEFTNAGFVNITSTSSIGNGGKGIIYSNIKFGKTTFCSAESNGGNGWELTNCSTYYLTVAARGNTGKGIEIVSGNTEIVMQNCSIQSNTSDGVKLTATSDYCKIIGGHFDSNGAYGINIADSTCDKTVISGNSFNGNSSGTLNDSGTGTVNTGNTT